MLGVEIVAALAAIVTITEAATRYVGKRNEVERNAYNLLSEALNVTERYLSIEQKKSATYVTNNDLTNRWHQASLAFREAGQPELRRLCQIKGDFWLDPTGWTRDDIREAGIQISEMRRHLDRVLRS